MPADRDTKRTWPPARSVAVGVGLAFIAGLVLSLIHGEPRELPAVAMDWPVLLHILRACAAAGLVGIGALVVLRLWAGELPTKVSTTGAEWAMPLQGPDRDVREELVRVERESKAAIDALTAVVKHLARRLQVDPRQAGFDSLQAAFARWESALDEAERKDALAEAMAALPEQEKLTVALLYYENLSLVEVAEVLGVSFSRAAQIRGRALQRLRRRLGYKPFGGDEPQGAT